MFKIFHKLTPYEKIVGEFTDEEIKVMGSVYNYIMRKDDKNFGDKMWINNCYNNSICMRTFGKSNPDCHISQLTLTSEECKNIQEAMNNEIYLNLLELDPTVKKTRKNSILP